MLSYFSTNFDRVSIRKQREGTAGLRPSQLGAVHALASHFALHDEPALIVMPTGTGKTAVLMLLPFIMEARRVLILTPSQVVRGQIAEDYGVLKTLCELNVAPKKLAKPRVLELSRKMLTSEDWEEIQGFDVVVATPNTIAPGILRDDAVSPPRDLFDLILFDEAHHSAAKSWATIMGYFSSARKALFTATPFRRDKLEIPGKIVYNYPISRAHDEGVFGDIAFLPAAADVEGQEDVAIAKKVEEVFNNDRAAGFCHKVMVRTDSLDRAPQLAEVYKQNTDLRLEQITSKHTYSRARDVLERLQADELDGIICVDMLGEGFNLPTLKIAAIHAPHKSLAVTLQFIGRFARTTADRIGTAKFIAAPTDIEIESQRLFEEGAVWQRIVHNLSETRVNEEVEIRHAIQSFALKQRSQDVDDVSLFTLNPHVHAKVFQATVNNLENEIKFPNSFEVIYRQVSKDESTVVLITREKLKPDWSRLDSFSSVLYDLFVIYYHRESQLLFICASRRTETLYDSIARQLADGEPKILSLSRINKVLLGLTNLNFFSVGMRNRAVANSAESYRMIAGSKAQKGISRSDARVYHRGHQYGTALENDKPVTIGVSSASKIWSAEHLIVPQLVRWCKKQAEKMMSDATPNTGSEIDYLETGIEVSEIPEGVIAAEWAPDAYLHPSWVVYSDGSGKIDRRLLFDFELRVDEKQSNGNRIRFDLHAPNEQWAYDFFLAPQPHCVYVNNGTSEPVLLAGEEEVSIERYFHFNPPQFHFANMSYMIGNQFFPFSIEYQPFDQSLIEGVNWIEKGVDPTLEFGLPRNGLISVHDYLKEELCKLDVDIVLYDHGTGEVADFVTVKQHTSARVVEFTLYHCKGSGGMQPGDRVGDVYEVAGQAVKSIIWVHKNDELLKKILHRVKSCGSAFLKGDEKSLRQIIADTRTMRSAYSIAIVQPGISKSDLSQKQAYNLAAVHEYLRGQHFEQLLVMASH